MRRSFIISIILVLTMLTWIACGGSSRPDGSGSGSEDGASGDAGPSKVQKKFNISGNGSNMLEAMKDGYKNAIQKALKEILGEGGYSQNESKLAAKFWEPTPIKAKKYFIKRKVVGKTNGGKTAELMIILDISAINKALADLSLGTVDKPEQVEEPEGAKEVKEVIEKSMDTKEIKKLLAGKIFVCWFKASEKFNKNHGNIAVGRVNKSLKDLELRVKDASTIEKNAQESLAATGDSTGGTTEMRELLKGLGADIFIHVYGDFNINPRKVGSKEVYEATGNLGYKIFDGSNGEIWCDENGYFRAVAEKEDDAVTRVIEEVHKNLLPKCLEKSARQAKQPEEFIVQIDGLDETSMVDKFKNTLKKDTSVEKIRSEKGDETVIFRVMYKGTLDDLIDGISYDLREDEDFEGMKLNRAEGKKLNYSL